jgi:hypothetical protein
VLGVPFVVAQDMLCARQSFPVFSSSEKCKYDWLDISIVIPAKLEIVSASRNPPARFRELDALVFTGGIGENAASIRARVCRDASWLGLELGEEANARGGPCISRAGSRVRAWVKATNEELMIALHTRHVLGVGI